MQLRNSYCSHTTQRPCQTAQEDAHTGMAACTVVYTTTSPRDQLWWRRTRRHVDGWRLQWDQHSTQPEALRPAQESTWQLHVGMYTRHMDSCMLDCTRRHVDGCIDNIRQTYYITLYQHLFLINCVLANTTCWYSPPTPVPPPYTHWWNHRLFPRLWSNFASLR